MVLTGMHNSQHESSHTTICLPAQVDASHPGVVDFQRELLPQMAGDLVPDRHGAFDASIGNTRA
jgi:hypothetical protein